MKIVNGKKVEIVSVDDYHKRFPNKGLCEMCPIRNTPMCDAYCQSGEVFVEINSSIIWR